MPSLKISDQAATLIEQLRREQGLKNRSQVLDLLLAEWAGESETTPQLPRTSPYKPSPAEAEAVAIYEEYEAFEAPAVERSLPAQLSAAVQHPVIFGRTAWFIATGYLATGKFYAGRSDVHPGWDYNLITGGDSDAGEAVVAIADGVVISAGVLRGWGGVVTVLHPQFNWRSRYAHVNNFRVKVGEGVKAGQALATIAPARFQNGKLVWRAHLHFDIAVKTLTPGHWCGKDAGCVRTNYLDLLAWSKQHGLAPVRALPEGNKLSFA